MARPSFLTDEHIPNAVAIGLRARGVDASTAAEAKQLDPDHLRLHANGVPHAGILFAPPDATIGLLIGGAMLVAEVMSPDEMLDRV